VCQEERPSCSIATTVLNEFWIVRGTWSDGSWGVALALSNALWDLEEVVDLLVGAVANTYWITV
jgi:hypothetical protein